MKLQTPYLRTRVTVVLGANLANYGARGWPRTVGHDPSNLNHHGGKSPKMNAGLIIQRVASLGRDGRRAE